MQLRPNGFVVTALLTALVALGPISTDLYLPSLPAMARAFGAPPAEIQLTLSVFLAGFAAAQLLYGPLSDRFGRRPALLGGVALYTAASVACVFAPTVEWLIAARFVQAVGACAGPVLCRAVVRDVHGREGAARVLAYMSAAMALAPALGPILGGFLEIWYGWRANFAALSAYGALGLVAAALLLPETNPALLEGGSRAPGGLLAGFGSLLRHRAYVGYALSCAFAYSGIFAFISGSSFVLVDWVGLPPNLYGFCFAAVAGGYMVGTLIAGRLSRRLGMHGLMRIGGAVAAAAGLLYFAVGWSGVEWRGAAGAVALVAPIVLYILGTGLVLPNAQAGAVGPFPRRAGTASALLGFAQMTLAALTGIVVGHLQDDSARAMTAAVAAMALAIPAAFHLLVRPAAAATAPRPDGCG